jgi:hypothetical protein
MRCRPPPPRERPALTSTRVTEMSLRMFHLFFIALSVIMAAFVATWAIGQYRLQRELEYAVVIAGSVALGAGLAVYGTKFQRKTRHL